MADIHANREAFEACLVHAQSCGAQQWIFLGDHVNYGADPEWVVDQLMSYVSAGAVALLGNHDAAVAERRLTMDSPAEMGMEWTRVQLGAAQRAFLARLPLTHEQDDTLFVHADATAPLRWNYVVDGYGAARSLRATSCRATICGHVHRPATYSLSNMGHVTSFHPIAGVPVPLLKERRWLAVLGSVGQPRDGNPAACYAILDTQNNQVTYCRIPYDIDTAAAKIRQAGLPERFAERLFCGE